MVVDYMNVKEISEKIVANVKEVVKGNDEVILKTVISLLSEGNILFEDVPGTGKTTLAKALSKSIGCNFSRIQFTPDLLPSDVTGINFYNRKENEFILKRGPAFTNILLADEINRATPRTQSSLLECMEEHQVTIDGETFKLEAPFIVLATQNPIEIQGTYPLPEAQLDRFFMRLSLGYPEKENEKEILFSQKERNLVDDIKSVVTAKEVVEAQLEVKKVKVSEPVADYIVDIVNATRNNEKIRLGVSPRGTKALMIASQATAAVNGRDYVLPDDVKFVAEAVLTHRLMYKGVNLLLDSNSENTIIKEIISEIEAPIV